MRTGGLEDVNRGFARELCEVQSKGRPDFRCATGAPGSNVEESWHCSPGSALHKCFTGKLQLLHGCCIGKNTGAAVVVHWYFADVSLVLNWYDTGHTLVLHLCEVGIALVLNWYCAGTTVILQVLDCYCTVAALLSRWYGTGTARVLHSYHNRYCTHTAVVPHWCYSLRHMFFDGANSYPTGATPTRYLCYTHIALVLCRYSSCTLRYSIRTPMVLHWWYRNGLALVLHWHFTGTTLARHCHCAVAALVLHWCYTSPVLVLQWCRTPTALLSY